MEHLDVGCTLIIIDILLIFIETYHLTDDRFGVLVERGQCEGGDSYIDIAQFSYDWLQFSVIYSIQRFDYL